MREHRKRGGQAREWGRKCPCSGGDETGGEDRGIRRDTIRTATWSWASGLGRAVADAPNRGLGRLGKADSVATLVVDGVELAEEDVSDDPERRSRNVEAGKGAEARALDLEDVVLGRERVRLAAKVEGQVRERLDRVALDGVCAASIGGGSASCSK